MKLLSGFGIFLLCSAAAATFPGCKHDDGVLPTSVKRWDNVIISAKNEVPAPAGRTEEGELTLELLSDNSLKYDFHIHNLAPTDALSMAHIHFADAGNSGPVFIDLKPTFIGAAATGTVANLRQGQIDTLLNQPVYFNVHSNQVGSGIARAQLDKTVELAMDIPLSGANEVPAGTTAATGLAILRLTSDKILYSKISVTGIEAGDSIRVAHIHRGGAGVNGPVRLFLANNIDEFGVVRVIPVLDSIYTMIKNDPMYVNAHSKIKAAGLVRGQLR
ncbi:MAG: CHRD domain-containing protein [Chitinophagaceae bacterium]|nr:CHRD domain-containing protein [Chitinophagaceae bacterium]